MAEKQVVNNKLISKYEFYFETPLYEGILAEDLAGNLFEGDVDAYSAKNRFETTYSIHKDWMGEYSGDAFSNYWKIYLQCKRTSNDILTFVVYSGKLNNGKEFYIKVGQFPSLADIQFAEIGKKYDKYLSREDIKEFKRAIGLAANGVGVGSFVYLRRIFENLINNTFQKYSTSIETTPTDFKVKRMEEKVAVLKDYLPSQLVEMKSVYSILSKGVHELSEQDCLKYFGVMKLSIELILEQQIDADTKAQRDKAVKKQLQQINGELAGKNNESE